MGLCVLCGNGKGINHREHRGQEQQCAMHLQKGGATQSLLEKSSVPLCGLCGEKFSLASAAYIPGSFIPASRRAKLAFPMSLNIFRICAYCRKS